MKWKSSPQKFLSDLIKLILWNITNKVQMFNIRILYPDYDFQDHLHGEGLSHTCIMISDLLGYIYYINIIIYILTYYYIWFFFLWYTYKIWVAELLGWQGGSNGRVSTGGSSGRVSYSTSEDLRFEPRQQHKNKLW